MTKFKENLRTPTKEELTKLCESIKKDKLFQPLRNILDMGADFSGITVSDKAIKKAIDGNLNMCEVLLTIISERIEWWIECDINKALYAKETYDILKTFYEMENTDNG